MYTNFFSVGRIASYNYPLLILLYHVSQSMNYAHIDLQ